MNCMTETNLEEGHAMVVEAAGSLGGRIDVKEHLRALVAKKEVRKGWYVMTTQLQTWALELPATADTHFAILQCSMLVDQKESLVDIFVLICVTRSW